MDQKVLMLMHNVNQVLKKLGTYTIHNNECYHVENSHDDYFGIVHFTVEPKKLEDVFLSYSVNGSDFFQNFKHIKPSFSHIMKDKDDTIHICFSVDGTPASYMLKPDVAQFTKNESIYNDIRSKETSKKLVRWTRIIEDISEDILDGLKTKEVPVLIVTKEKMYLSDDTFIFDKSACQIRIDKKFLLPMSFSNLKLKCTVFNDDKAHITFIVKEKNMEYEQTFNVHCI
jgi:hypothetical protein